MKKDKVKSAKRTIKDDIKLSLVKGLKALTGKFGNASDKLDKEINRTAKKLAKTISKDIKIEEPAAVTAAQPKDATKAVKAAETPKPATDAGKATEAPKPVAKTIKAAEAPKPAAKTVKTVEAPKPAAKAVKTAEKKVKAKAV